MAALMLSTVATFAQNEVGQWSIMPKIGLGITNYLGDDLDLSTRCGFVGGAEFEYGVTDIFSVSAGALYSMQGGKRDGVTIKGDYINIPILANVYVTKGLAVKLGLQPGFNVNSEATFSGETQSLDAKTFDFSIPVGVSYEYRNFVLDARYNWGLTKVYSYTDAKNSVFQITLGYKFAL